MTADGTPTPRTGETITVPRPHVLHGPVGVPADRADADYLRSAARNIEHRADAVRSLWGSGVTAMVVRLLTDAADALERPDAPQPAPTDDAVERAARALFSRNECADFLWDGEDTAEVVRDAYRADARAALAAAGAGEADPHVGRTGHRWPCTRFYVTADKSDPCTCAAPAGEAVDREALASTIWHASRADEGTISATGAGHVADAVLALLAARGDAATPTVTVYEPCVIDEDGRCTRWSHSHIDDAGEVTP